MNTLNKVAQLVAHKRAKQQNITKVATLVRAAKKQKMVKQAELNKVALAPVGKTLGKLLKNKNADKILFKRLQGKYKKGLFDPTQAYDKAAQNKGFLNLNLSNPNTRAQITNQAHKNMISDYKQNLTEAFRRAEGVNYKYNKYKDIERLVHSSDKDLLKELQNYLDFSPKHFGSSLNPFYQRAAYQQGLLGPQFANGAPATQLTNQAEQWVLNSYRRQLARTLRRNRKTMDIYDLSTWPSFN